MEWDVDADLDKLTTALEAFDILRFIQRYFVGMF
jgi:hypothetical protein